MFMFYCVFYNVQLSLTLTVLHISMKATNFKVEAFIKENKAENGNNLNITTKISEL